eukprot:9850420-Lingulodinium_polyedra.AAC.1
MRATSAPAVPAEMQRDITDRGLVLGPDDRLHDASGHQLPLCNEALRGGADHCHPSLPAPSGPGARNRLVPM